MIVVAVAAVVFSGVGTALVTRARARQEAKVQLGREASALVPFVLGGDPDLSSTTGRTDARVARRVEVARRALRLVDATVVVVDPAGNVVGGPMPEGVDAREVVGVTAGDGARSGGRGRRVWAAAASEPGPSGRRLVIVLTRELPVTAGALPWVAVSGVVAVLLAVAAAGVIARRLSEPLTRIGAATYRIAEGDLGSRVGELPDADDESIALARSIDHMAASLERSRGTQRDFLLSVSHDLRTPLTSMRGYAEAIVDGAAPDARRAAEVILRESMRMERLVTDLLDMARLESDQFTLTSARVDLVAVIESSVVAFLPAATDAGIVLETVGSRGPIEVMADADRLRQVFANLVENALKFARTAVRLHVQKDGPAVHVSVVDDGPGIGDADLARVFDRGFTARPVPHGDRPRPAGSGLGLAISRDLVTAMGGTLGVTSGVSGAGSGTTMTVTFPIA